MNELFSILNDYTFQIVCFGSAILGIISGLIGSFSVLRKQSLLGDALSHAALPGVAIIFLLTGIKNTNFLLIGAIISGSIAVFLIHGIIKNSKIKFDSSLALIMSVFFGFGMVLLTYIQKLPNANQAGLNRFIFGQASTMLLSDIYTISFLGILVLVFLLLFWKELKLFSFDVNYMRSVGINSSFIGALLSLLTVFSIVVGLQTVGAILMSAMIIAPGVAARQWTNKLWLMLILASFFGSISGIIGTLISSYFYQIPTGPVIVVVLSIIVFFSILFSPKRGILWKKYRKLGEIL